MGRSQPVFRPFAARGRRTIFAVLVTFALVFGVSVSLSIRATGRSRHQATVLQVAARQRTLAERYVSEILLVRAGRPADPQRTARLLVKSADALLHGGEAPEVAGDDDEAELPPASGAVIRAQLEQERRLVADLTWTGGALLADHPEISSQPLTANEHIAATDPVRRLRVLAALTANVSLDAARSVASAADGNVSRLIVLQVVLGAAGLLVSLVLALALVRAARRQTAHFRSLVTSSTDLVLVFGDGQCRYVSQSVATALGVSESELLGAGFADHVDDDDRAALAAVCTNAEPRQLVFRLRNRFGQWRSVEAHVTDLRHDRHIHGIVLNGRDVTDRVRLEEELSKAAFSDSLTALANRALFRDHLTQALARAARRPRPLAVLLADLDGFKAVNDSLGHDVGDEVLVEVAGRFASLVRPGDTVARLGGDEFTVLLEDIEDLDAAEEVARRLLAALEEPIGAQRELRVGVSIGIAYLADGTSSYEDLLRNADIAMYVAKNQGRGQVAVYEPSMHARARHHLQLSLDLDRALEREQLSVHYQPTLALESNQLEGMEALARWNHPQRGLVPPNVFIPLAEQTGQVVAIGRWVLEQACRQAAAWQAEFPSTRVRTMGVNVSGRQLADVGFVSDVQSILHDTGVDPQTVMLEITESILMDDVDGITRRLHELKNLGVRLAIDDFGTGYSSLAYLRQFPVDVLKIDKTFVEAAASGSAGGAALVRAIVDMSRSLQLVTVAEGIERPVEAEHMLALGCSAGQGFLFARPMPATDLTDFLRQSALAGVDSSD